MGDKQNQPSFSFMKDHDHHNNNDGNGIKLCGVCNRVFSSGKALGGHMRIHAPGYKELMISRKKFKPENQLNFKKSNHKKTVDFGEKYEIFTESKNVAECDNKKKEKKPICVMCGKNFKSMKSLFGHMRLHPERDWRGVVPPPSAVPKNSCSSSLSDAELENVNHGQIDSDGNNQDCVVVDLRDSLPCRWSVTAKRGSKAMVKYPDARKLPLKTNTQNPRLDEVQVETSSVVSICNEEELDAVDGFMMLINGSFETDSTHEKKVHEFDAANSNSLTTKIEIQDPNPVIGSKRQRIEEFPSGVINSEQMSYKNCGNSIENGMMIKSKKRRKKMKLRDLGNVNKSSHNKFSLVLDNSIGESPPLVENTHYDPMETQFNMTMSPSEVSHGGPILMDFDLNERPPMEDEGYVDSEQIRGYGYGYSSYSQNSVA